MTAMDELSRLLVAERATKAPTLVKQQGFERLAQSVAAGTPPLPVSAAALQLGRWLPFKWLGVGFVVGVVAATGAAQLAAQSDSPERADNTARSGVLPSAAVGSTAAEPVPSLPATGVAGAPAELPAGTRGGSPTFASSQSAPTASSAPTFDEE